MMRHGDFDFIFQSTPPVKAATTAVKPAKAQPQISIHAAREGGDWGSTRLRTSLYIFQSTPPVKAATAPRSLGRCRYGISIHAAREGGDFAVFAAVVHGNHISIHAAREGGDWGIMYSSRWGKGFQSTPPVKAATGEGLEVKHEQRISIHAAREGGD